MGNLDTPQEESSFISNSAIKDYLIEASKWAKFLAIVGFVGLGFMVIFAIFMMSDFAQLNRAPFGEKSSMVTAVCMYLTIGLVYFFPINYLYQFSIKIKQGIQSNDLSIVAAGFQNLKSLFKFMGILMAIILSLYALISVIAILTISPFK